MQIVVFEQNGSGREKIDGIGRFGRGIEISRIIRIDEALPDFIDEPEAYIDDDFSADLVLDYLIHPDLSHYLVSLCVQKGIPVIASGRQSEGALTPFTCCGLGRHKNLGPYGEQFGLPEYRVTLAENRIIGLEVLRGAPCGATWDVLPQVIGVEVDEALSLLPREIQYLCVANPSRFDPVSGKSPVHYAGHVHRAALQKGIDQARKQGEKEG